MKKTIIIIARTVIALTALVGCTTTQNTGWSHPNNNQSQLTADISECEYEALKHTNTFFYNPGLNILMSSIRTRELVSKCLKARGYKPKEVLNTTEADADLENWD